MTTAAIRAKLAARGITSEAPFGCRWCGEEGNRHGRRWHFETIHADEIPDQTS